MNKDKKFSITLLDKIVKENIEEKVVVDFYGSDLSISRFLDLTQMIQFVNQVVDGCFDDSTGEYIPEAKGLLIDRNTVLYYANVNLPDDFKHMYDILTKTGIADTIRENIDKRQYGNILRAIDEKVDAKIYTNEQLFTNKLSSAISTMESLSNNITDLFKDMSPDQMKAALGAISGGMDETKLVEAVLSHEVSKDGDAN